VSQLWQRLCKKVMKWQHSYIWTVLIKAERKKTLNAMDCQLILWPNPAEPAKLMLMMDNLVSVLQEQYKHKASATQQQFTLIAFIPYFIWNWTTLNHLKVPQRMGWQHQGVPLTDYCCIPLQPKLTSSRVLLVSKCYHYQYL
jgi:hypothetical protein